MEHRKDKKNKKNNKHNENDGAGSRHMERLRSELFGSWESPEVPEVLEWIQEGQGRAGKGTTAWKYISEGL